MQSAHQLPHSQYIYNINFNKSYCYNNKILNEKFQQLDYKIFVDTSIALVGSLPLCINNINYTPPTIISINDWSPRVWHFKWPLTAFTVSAAFNDSQESIMVGASIMLLWTPGGGCIKYISIFLLHQIQLGQLLLFVSVHIMLLQSCLIIRGATAKFASIHLFWVTLFICSQHQWWW